MTPYEKRPCKMTRRLAEDMKIRNLAPATIDAYTFHARRFADFIRDTRTASKETSWLTRMRSAPSRSLPYTSSR